MTHTHYVALVSGTTPETAREAADTLLEESYGLGTPNPLYDWYSVGGRWSGTLQHTPDAPGGDYSTHSDGAVYDPEPTLHGANIIRARSLDFPDRRPGETLADDLRAQAVWTATSGLTPPAFPGSYSDPSFMDDFNAMIASPWMEAARRAWAETATANDPADGHLSTDEAPYLINPDLYVRYRATFATRHYVAGYLIDSPEVFTRVPDGLDFNDDGTAYFRPRDHVKTPWDSMSTQEQMLRNLDRENTWLVSLDLHD